MSYLVKYIKCKICGSDEPRFLGVRGNLEFYGAAPLKEGKPHMVTNVVKCNNCGFVYTNPKILLSEEESKNFYSQVDEYVPSADLKNLFRSLIELIEKYKQKGIQIGSLVESKNKQYGNSFNLAGEFLNIIYPDGIKPHQYTDALALVRIFDKIMRIAQRSEDGKLPGNESAYSDLAGYGILGAVRDDENNAIIKGE